MVLDDCQLYLANLVPGAVNYTGGRELSQYFVKRCDILKRTIKAKNYVVVSKTLGRRIFGFFLTIYFPIIFNDQFYTFFLALGRGTGLIQNIFLNKVLGVTSFYSKYFSNFFLNILECPQTRVRMKPG